MASIPSIRQLSDDLANLVVRVRPALVYLQRTRVPVTGTVWADDRVITAAHALGPRDEGTVLRDDGQEAKARVLGRDPTTDVALLEVPGVSLQGLEWAADLNPCLLYTSPSPRDRTRSRMPSSA